MRQGRAIATAFLAIGFAAVSFILVVIEPKMGFSGAADYFDPAKLLAGIESVAWLLGDLIYLGFGAALASLALSSADRYERSSGLTAAVLFVFIACIGRVFASLPGFIEDNARLEAALLGLVAARFAALKTMVVALGVFAWRTTRGDAPGQSGSLAWRGFGYLVLAASVAFVFAFLPMPLLFTVWAAWLAVREARAA